jgi:hypothetical protein
MKRLPPMVSVRFHVPPDLRDRVFAEADAENISAAEFWRRAAEERLGKQPTINQSGD